MTTKINDGGNRLYADVRHIQTNAGRIYLRDTGGHGRVIVCIDGNSTSGKIYKEFVKSLRTGAEDDYRCLVLDLPGHGKSSDATQPDEVYSLYGYATAISEVLKALVVNEFSLVGHSLGGHVAAHLIAKAPEDVKVQSAVLMGTPPLAADPTSLGAAFKPTEAMGLTGKGENFSPDEASCYIGAHSLDVSKYPKLLSAAIRTDGKARGLMMKSVGEGRRCDEVLTLSSGRIPYLLLNGAEDQFVSMPYVNGLDLGEHGKRASLDGEGHAPIVTQPAKVADLVKDFIRSSL